MSGTDVVYFYTDPRTGEAYYGVRDLYVAWVAAGEPPINSAGRLYAVQKAARVAYLNGTGAPADDPDQPGSYELGHCRFAALDIDATPARVRALTAAGLVRPFSWESWHWRLPNIYNYPIIHSIPAVVSDGATQFPSEEDDMFNDEDRALLRSAVAEAEAAKAGIWNGGSNFDEGEHQFFSYGVLPIVAHSQTVIAAQLAALTELITQLAASGDEPIDYAKIEAIVTAAVKAAAPPKKA